ncbi:hypothetical protein FA95DRAFT_1606768 [Auriscalpium vulgare]|uniref:Uncharacterized protein n=1 Tax=Auriscalpium vulgare TaxID=40419 RepID=A0ACB8RSG2_9AGAM|nr:hypothetical protein FA95DRAFT_1606768 [Auriscalpium vulgare]
MPATPQLICGYVMSYEGFEKIAAARGLPHATAAITFIVQELGLYPRVKVFLARGKVRSLPCLTVATNNPLDRRPILPADQIQRIKDHSGVTQDPKWYYKA